jgi:putative restriction endonuclease
MWSEADDLALREEAMEWLAAWTQDGLDAISYEDLGDFRFREEKMPLKDRQLGIRKPVGLTAALSITTTYRAPDKERPYDDRLGDDGLMRYKWDGDDPEKYTNRGLRVAMLEKRPLIWFWGVAQGMYKPIFPVYIVAEEREHQQFVVATDGLQNIESTGRDVDEVTKRYVLQETRRRLHQPVFRGLVMRAYGTRCAICKLRHSALLDAAHIVPDAEPDGVAAVRNGLALCKIHHAAYDAGIIGISPDYEIGVREDVLHEVDGPMLEFGLKGLHGNTLGVLPSTKKERPDQTLLERQYRRFQTGAVARPLRADYARLTDL